MIGNLIAGGQLRAAAVAANAALRHIQAQHAAILARQLVVVGNVRQLLLRVVERLKTKALSFNAQRALRAMQRQRTRAVMAAALLRTQGMRVLRLHRIHMPAKQ